MQATLTSSNDSASSCTENALDTTPSTSRAQASSSVRGAAGASEVAKLEQQSSSSMPAASWQASAGVAMSLDCVCNPAACLTSGEQALVARDLPSRAGDGGRGDQHARAEHWPTHQLMEVRGDSQSTLDHSLSTSADRCQKRRARRVEWGAFFAHARLTRAFVLHRTDNRHTVGCFHTGRRRGHDWPTHHCEPSWTLLSRPGGLRLFGGYDTSQSAASRPPPCGVGRVEADDARVDRQHA